MLKLSRAKAIYIFILFLCLILGSTLTLAYQHFTQKDNYQADNSELRLNPNGQVYTNPLLACDSFTPRFAPLKKLEDQMNEIITKKKNQGIISRTSVVFRDLNNGTNIFINPNESYSPASLAKVPLLIAYLKFAQDKDPTILSKKITYQGTPTTMPNILPVQNLVKNQTYTVQELLERMIIYSDNNAYDLLTENIDNAFLVKVYKDLDIDITRALEDPTGNSLTVRDQAQFFRILYNASYLNSQYSELALSIFVKTQYEKGIIAGVSKDVKVANKFGERSFGNQPEKQLHDCGIVYTWPRPYEICILAQGVDFKQLSTTIAQISSLTFQYWTSFHPELKHYKAGSTSLIN